MLFGILNATEAHEWGNGGCGNVAAREMMVQNVNLFDKKIYRCWFHVENFASNRIRSNLCDDYPIRTSTIYDKNHQIYWK